VKDRNGQALAYLLKNSDRFAKTIVFCVNQEHASERWHSSTMTKSKKSGANCRYGRTFYDPPKRDPLAPQFHRKLPVIGVRV
jgi:hypothetical protein